MSSVAARQEAPERPAAAGDDALLSASGRLSSARWRVLETLFQKFCEAAAARLSALAGAEISVLLERLWSAPPEETGVGDGRYDIALCEVEGLRAKGCIGCDRGAADLFAEAFLGGGAQGRARPEEARPFSAFDRLLTGKAGEELAAALEEVLSPLLEIGLKPGRPGVSEPLDALGGEERPVLAARLTVDALGETGGVLMLLPQAAFSGLRACAPEKSPDEESETSGRWRERLSARVRAAEVVCSAVIDGGEMTLAEVSALRPGQVLMLRARAENPVTLLCDGAPLYRCELGQADGLFTLRIGESIDEEKEFLNAVVKG